MIKVLIADDHPIVRQGLRQILSGIPESICRSPWRTIGWSSAMSTLIM